MSQKRYRNNLAKVNITSEIVEKPYESVTDEL